MFLLRLTSAPPPPQPASLLPRCWLPNPPVRVTATPPVRTPRSPPSTHWRRALFSLSLRPPSVAVVISPQFCVSNLEVPSSAARPLHARPPVPSCSTAVSS
ncbi:hypothetical protein ZWY2020_006352 [Hordeum vulgare]|nr:hypothetical protein ZWY2020_006352 [Hordeum vulgare]